MSGRTGLEAFRLRIPLAVAARVVLFFLVIPLAIPCVGVWRAAVDTVSIRARRARTTASSARRKRATTSVPRSGGALRPLRPRRCRLVGAHTRPHAVRTTWLDCGLQKRCAE